MVNARSGAVGLVLAGLLACGGSGESAQEGRLAAEVEIAAPASGEAVGGGAVIVQLIVRGVEIRPAGTDEPNTGHHHLFVDRDITPPGETIPAEEGIIHLGGGQTEAEIPLEPGTHTIIAVLGDHEHVRLAEVKTDTVTVVVN